MCIFYMQSIMKTFFSILFLLIPKCKSFFIPVATSVSVNRVAKSIELSDSVIVVSRNSTGHPVGFHDYCPHRGASFNNVVLKGDSIECPYHGFEFNTHNGNLTSGLGVKPGCSSLKMVECIESSGLIWVCIDGNNETTPPQDLSDVYGDTFRKIRGSVKIKCPVEQLVENVIDSIHLHMVHSFGNGMDPEPVNYKTQKVSKTRGEAMFQYNAGKGSMFSGVLDVHNWYDSPCTAGTSVTSGKDVKIVQVHAVQLKNGITHVFWELYRNWAMGTVMDVIFDLAMQTTLNEDKVILENCSFDKGGKFNGKYDKLQLMYRRSLKNADN